MVPRDHADDAFGAQPRYPARRRTSADTPAVYASMSVAGALLEIPSHTQGSAPDDLMLALAAVGGECIREAVELPPNWREHPCHAAVQRYGDRWVSSRDDRSHCSPARSASAGSTC